MGMTNRETLKTVIDNINSDGEVPQEQWNTVLLTSIANSLAIIADALTENEAESEKMKMEDTRQCCNPFPCPYIGKDKPCEECNCYREADA